MKFCVLITCYNKSEFIADAIRSAQAEYKSIIIVDDCSTDNSKDVINSFSGLDKLFLDKNVGVTKATIAGLQRAIELGFEFVTMLDGDDVLASGACNIFHELIVEQGFTAIYGTPNRSKKQDMRTLAEPCKFDGVEEIKYPLERWLEYGKATTALCAKPEDMLASIFPDIIVQDHQIGYSIHKNAKKIGYISALTHAYSRATEVSLSRNKYVVSISDIKLFNSIYCDVKDIDELKHYAKRIHIRCGKLRHFPNKVGYKLMFELYIRRFVFLFHTTKSIFELSQKIVQKIETPD